MWDVGQGIGISRSQLAPPGVPLVEMRELYPQECSLQLVQAGIDALNLVPLELPDAVIVPRPAVLCREDFREQDVWFRRLLRYHRAPYHGRAGAPFTEGVQGVIHVSAETLLLVTGSDAP